MKRNEIIELNGVEYTLELNRDSFIQIDKLCNISKTMQILHEKLYDYMDEVEIDDTFDINTLTVNEDELEAEAEKKDKALNRMFERAFLLWANPNHHLSISEVREILKPYFEDEEKANWLGKEFGRLMNECLEIRKSYNEERKNLKAQISK